MSLLLKAKKSMIFCSFSPNSFKEPSENHLFFNEAEWKAR